MAPMVTLGHESIAARATDISDRVLSTAHPACSAVGMCAMTSTPEARRADQMAGARRVRLSFGRRRDGRLAGRAQFEPVGAGAVEIEADDYAEVADSRQIRSFGTGRILDRSEHPVLFSERVNHGAGVKVLTGRPPRRR